MLVYRPKGLGDAHEGRNFIVLLGGAAAAWPSAAQAQNAARIARIGYLTLLSPSPLDDAFLEGLRDLGWIEGQNIAIDRRFCPGDVERLKRSAAELVELKVDVILAFASAAAQPARDTTSSIPIVFAATGDPIGQGFVASLARQREGAARFATASGASGESR
jgi:putative ABC transport system substrate-binding protein